MRKIIYILLLATMVCSACVGRKDDPEQGQETGPVVVPGGGDEGTVFFHRTLVLEFTGTWCQYCPMMAAALEEAKGLRPGRLVEIAVHGYDEMSADEAETLAGRFKVSGYPSVVFDLDAGTKFGEHEASKFTNYVDAAANQACGLALDASNGRLTVKVKAVSGGQYSLGLAVVEDGIVAYQTGYGEGYVNNAVLRRFLSSGLDGDSLGELAEGEERTVEYDCSLTPAQRVVAYVLQDGKSINALSCGSGEVIEYTYEEN